MRVFVLVGLLAGLALSPMATRAATITLDGDSAATGLNLVNQPMSTEFGTISFTGEFVRFTSDREFIAAGASGNQFDIAAGSQALLSFSFDVSQASFLYGGNRGSIFVEALDAFGSVIDSFYQADTYRGRPAGMATVAGAGIRFLRWSDPGNRYAALDNIELTVQETTAVPLPATLPLMAAALAGLFALRRRRRS